MASKINNFGLKKVAKDKQPHLDFFIEIEGYTIFRSNFNDSFFSIYDEALEVFRVIEYFGMDPVSLMENLEAYIKYYKGLPSQDKETLI